MKNAIIRALTLGLALSFSTVALAQDTGGDKPAKKEKKTEKTEKKEKTDKKGKTEKKEEKTEKTEKAPAGGW